MSFTSLPPVPQVGVPEWQFQFLNNVKQNVEVLTGQRGNTGFEAITSGRISVQPIGDLSLRQVTATGAGFTISGVNVASVDDYAKLIVDVQTLIKDVLNTLISQLKN